MKRFVVISLLLIMTISAIEAQKPKSEHINKKSAGVLIEYGLPYYYLPEGENRYYVLLVGGVFGIPIYKTSNFFNVSIDFYPHYAYVWVSNCNYYEFGLNVRVRFNFAVSANDILSAQIGSGPHFINCETQKQSNGFIFSDNFLVSYRRGFRISKTDFALDLEFGYRHISNAGLKDPNRSISNFIFGLGYYWLF